MNSEFDDQLLALAEPLAGRLRLLPGRPFKDDRDEDYDVRANQRPHPVVSKGVEEVFHQCCYSLFEAHSRVTAERACNRALIDGLETQAGLTTPSIARAREQQRSEKCLLVSYMPLAR